MAPRPPAWLIAVVAGVAVACMATAVYFGGTGRTPLAMIGTVLFVVLGGVAFELARRRST